AVTLDITSQDSIKNAAKSVAAGMMQYYTGYRPGDVAGNLPAPYYWWETGAMFGSLIDYRYFTGDTTYNDWTMAAMMHQVGPDAVFMPANQTKTLGNDDQAFWAMAALSAAETRFPNPPSGQPQWLAVVQAVFNLQAARWDTTTCGGGLKWQIFAFNSGYNYKNTISNGCFFNIGARLAAYTGNSSYADLAERTWDWSQRIGLFDANYNFYDGSDDNINCTELDHLQWTYNAGTFLVGAANMYNFTNGSAIWEQRIRGIIGNLHVFLDANNVMFEVACEPYGTCNVDQRSFKAYLARWMAATIVRAHFTRPLLKPILEASARAAVGTCTGGSDGQQCGLSWNRTFDGQVGVGEQMSVLEVVQSNLIDYVEGPATEENGISKGNPGAGTGEPVGPGDLNKNPITTGDRIAAGVITVVIIVLVIGTVL
ncbi:hypothetical protein LTR66_017379, partial [Elasticomyces elasticus]